MGSASNHVTLTVAGAFLKGNVRAKIYVKIKIRGSRAEFEKKSYLF